MTLLKKPKKPKSATSNRRAQKQKVTDASEFFKSYRMLRYAYHPDPVQALPEYAKERQDADERIDEIADKYRLSTVKTALRTAIVKAIENKYHWLVLQVLSGGSGFGPASRVEQLRKYAEKMLALLSGPQVRNRMYEVASVLEGVPSATRGLEQALNNLLDLLAHADFAANKNKFFKSSDIGCACQPLMIFWKDAGGSQPIYKMEDYRYSEQAYFLFDCIELIDPSVTPRLIVDLLRERLPDQQWWVNGQPHAA